ncbi:MAG: type II secretion system F family protein [Candidatus Marinimicrobia bacterium]|jgi:type IV pilus assembly protein PilC|nr:type II secretion system F family protein [Candidatus Neomarinimicrobiota bacterium]MBT5955517.1 type II secretion system F family protein [Candidatus Neomarinimicrobiota bacterium]|tara:strand:- start:7359 stop:8600 length:1242 start_codon:yes stop_codon:yes gene_type:complete
MAQFNYIVRSQSGARQEGNIDAKNINDASEKLRADGLTVIKISERDTSFDFLTPFLERLNLEIEKFKNKVPLSTLVFFTRQLATMFASGLTIERSIFFLAQEEKSKKFKKVLVDLETNIKRGLLLSDALERHPGVFFNLYIALVRAGEVSGKLADTLDELSSYMETVEDTQRKVKSAMYYPVFIIGFLFFMMFITFTFIIPQFKSVYDQLGSELPYYTVLLVNISEWFQSNFFFLSFLIFMGLVVLWLLSLTDSGRLSKDRLLLKTPIFGALIEQGILSKFAKTFGILVGSGVSIMDSMGLLQKVVDNRVYELAINKAAKNIENGVNISTALKETGEFPPILIQLLATGEETGEIDGLALKASDFYTKQVNAIVDRLTSIIEPLLIVLVGAVIGGIVIVTYLPIFHFGEALAN